MFHLIISFQSAICFYTLIYIMYNLYYIIFYWNRKYLFQVRLKNIFRVAN